MVFNQNNRNTVFQWRRRQVLFERKIFEKYTVQVRTGSSILPQRVICDLLQKKKNCEIRCN